MAFDLAWGYRFSLAYVTDPAYQCWVGDTATYPTTFTNANGYSINAGWSSIPSFGHANRDATNDPRIAGMADQFDSGSPVFTVDLSSGSAPGAGTYTVDVAFGDAAAAHTNSEYWIKDNTTVILDATNGGAGYSLSADDYLDATLATVTATGTWTGATASIAFASTTVNLVLNPDNLAGKQHCLAHFRLTLQAAAVVGGSGNGRLMFVPRYQRFRHHITQEDNFSDSN